MVEALVQPFNAKFNWYETVIGAVVVLSKTSLIGSILELLTWRLEMPAIVLLDQVMVTPVTLVCGVKENVVPLQILGVVLVFTKTGTGFTV